MGCSGRANVTRTCAPGVRVTASCAAAAASAPPPWLLRGTPPETRRTPRTMPPSSASMEPLPRVTSKPPLSTKLADLREAVPTDAAGDVVRLGGRAEAGNLRSFLEGHRTPGFRQALDLFGEFEIDVAIKQYIKFVLQLRRANVFIANIGVRNLALVEGITDPADGVGVCPGNPHAEARSFCGVARNVGRGGGAMKSRPSSAEASRSASSKPSCAADESKSRREVSCRRREIHARRFQY